MFWFETIKTRIDSKKQIYLKSLESLHPFKIDNPNTEKSVVVFDADIAPIEYDELKQNSFKEIVQCWNNFEEEFVLKKHPTKIGLAGQIRKYYDEHLLNEEDFDILLDSDEELLINWLISLRNNFESNFNSNFEYFKRIFNILYLESDLTNRNKLHNYFFDVFELISKNSNINFIKREIDSY